jgi:hypothetical protein
LPTGKKKAIVHRQPLWLKRKKERREKKRNRDVKRKCEKENMIKKRRKEGKQVNGTARLRK